MKLRKKNNSQPTKKADQKSRYLVALDVGTEYVKALIGKVSGDNIEIIGVGRAHQKLADMQSGAISDIAGVVANCDRALNKAENMAEVDAREVMIGIAGELVKGTTATIQFRRKDAQKDISVDEMERIISLVQNRAEQNAKRSLALEVGKKDVDVRLVNSALVSIEIDAYKVSNPIGFQGKNMAIQLYTAYAPLIHIGALEKTATDLDLDLVAVAAEPFAVARSVLGSDASNNLSAILIDVGGGTTDIAVVNDGGVEGTKMFSIGGRSFTRTIANELNVDFSMAEEAKLRLSNGKLTDAQRKRIEGAVNRTLDVWISGVELALAEFDMLDHLPQTILLCGGGSSLSLLVDRLKNDDWYKSLPFTKKPQIQHISPEQVVGIVDKTDVIKDHTYITAMGLLRVGLDTISGDDAQDDSLRGRLNKILSI